MTTKRIIFVFLIALDSLIFASPLAFCQAVQKEFGGFGSPEVTLLTVKAYRPLGASETSSSKREIEVVVSDRTEEGHDSDAQFFSIKEAEDLDNALGVLSH